MNEVETTNESKPLPFCIIEASSEDRDFPASNLTKKSNTEGWYTAPNVPYPQHLIIQPILPPDVDPHTLRLSHIQILIQENHPPQQIELFATKTTTIGPGNNDNSISNSKEDLQNKEHKSDQSLSFTQRLGYVVFDNHEKIKNTQSIKLGDIPASMVKLVIHRPDDSHIESDAENSNGIDNNDGSNSSGDSGSDSNTSSSAISSSISSQITSHAKVGIISLSLFAKRERIKHIKTSEIISNDMELPIQHGVNSLSKDSNDVAGTPISSSPHQQQKEQRQKQGLTPTFNPTEKDVHLRMESLEEMKRECARNEEFEMAAKIKELLHNLNTLMNKLDETQNSMQCAADREEYLRASRFKVKRDAARTAFADALTMAEQIIANPNKVQGFFNTTPTNVAISNLSSNLDDLSLSTIRLVGDEDDQSAMITTTQRSLPIGERPIIPMKEDALNSSIYSDEHSVQTVDDISKRGDALFNDGHGNHPLEGVINHLDLPIPEELNLQEGGVGTSLNSTTSHTSTDSMAKIDAVLGPYRTRCLFSKNWVLREAALLKLSMNLKEAIANLKSSSSNYASDWWETFSRGICVILERAMDDRIVQVFLTGLILLDDCVIVFETMQVSQKEVIALIGNNIVLNLVGKLGDGNPKVVDGSDTALMSLSLSETVGPMYIGAQVMRLMSTKDSKSIKSVCKRCYFLKALLEEFGPEAPHVNKYMEFIQTYGLGHKDADTRDATKELSTSLYLRDGNITLSLLDRLSDRQVKEYKIAFSTARRKLEGHIHPSSNDRNVLKPVNTESNHLLQQQSEHNRASRIPSNTKYADRNYKMHNQNQNNFLRQGDVQTPGGGFNDGITKTPGRRGRGRGRSRRGPSQRYSSGNEILGTASRGSSRSTVDDILSANEF